MFILLTLILQFHSQVWAGKRLVMLDPLYLILGLPPISDLLLSISSKSMQWVTESLIQQKSIWFSPRVSFQVRPPGWSNSPCGHAIARTHPWKSVVRKREAPHLRWQHNRKISSHEKETSVSLRLAVPLTSDQPSSTFLSEHPLHKTFLFVKEHHPKIK